MHKIVSWYYTCVYCVGEREEVRERETDSQGNDENHRRWWNEVDFLTVVPSYSTGKGKSLQQMVLEPLDIHMRKKLNLSLYLTSYMKINSRLTHIYLNIKDKGMKL